MIHSENGIIIGCTIDGHSEISCEGCQISGTKRCPLYIERLPDVFGKSNINNIDNKNIYEQTGSEIGKLVSIKQKQYGNSFGKASEFLKILYPNGITLEQYNDMLALVRDFDKSMRIANGNQGEEDAWQDKLGYALLSVIRNKEQEK